MKKSIITKVLLACFIMALNGFLLNLQAQDVILEFTNPDGLDYGSSNDGFDGTGLGGRGDANVSNEDAHVTFSFSIGATGQIALDVSTATAYQPVVDVLKTWNSSNIGATDNAALFGKSFSLIMTAESRMQLGKDVDGNRGGLGIQGKNQRRIDDEGDNTEWMQFELAGDVGINFVRFGYNDVSGGSSAHAEIIDHDSDDIIPITDGVDGDPHPLDLYIDGAEYNMRYFTDMVRFTKSADSANMGYRLYSLEFNLVTPEPKPPAVAETTPAHADTTVETTDDYVIMFDVPVDQASAEGAVTFTPEFPGKSVAWDDESMVMTVSHDQLPYSTDYTVDITTGVKGAGTGGLNMLADTSFTFKTLPEPPTVDYTFPANLAEEIPVNTLFELQFSKGMKPDSVEKAISFTPEVGNISEFIWNSDNSTVYFSTDGLTASTQYFVTVDVVATDRFGVQLAAPFQFVFKTAAPVGVDNRQHSEMLVYPNPADEVLMIRGVNVKSAKIYSITGQLVKDTSNKPILNVGDLKAGSYVIVVRDNDDKKYQEMIFIK